MNVTIAKNPHVELLGHSRARLDQPFTVYLDSQVLFAVGVRGAEGFRLTVPAGFETDFASVLRLPVLYLLAGNTAHRAAIVHDYLYSVRAPRALADRVFRAAMKAEGVKQWRRVLMYAAVRLFGVFQYRKGNK